MAVGIWRRLAAEGLGAALLVAVVIGSGIMAERLAGGNAAVALLAHLMFELPFIQISTHMRSGYGQWVGEFVATFAFLAAIVGSKRNPAATPYMVGLVIMAGYWFTSSTSFANPAVTIARSISDTFAGIRPIDAPGFIVAQLIATALAVPFLAWLFGSTASRPAKQPDTPTMAPSPMKEQA